MLDLVDVHGASVQDPAINAAVSLGETFADEVNDHVIGQHFLVLQSEGQVLGERGWAIPPHRILQQLVHLNVHEFVLVGNTLCVLLFSAARRAH